VKEIEGDLIKLAAEGQFDVIIHGCNCYCQMGKGIALTIKDLFPEAYKADCNTQKASKEKLGSYSSAEVNMNGKKFAIVNAYTQYHWKGNGVKADYDAIGAVMKKIKRDYPGKRIGYPLVGAGLAGGDWSIISGIIDQKLEGEDHTLVRFRP
jgi:O-acetyl-ADP-ribose deacetylase (regulator of RNase III)